MEKEVQPNIPPVQPIPSTPTSIPIHPPTNWSKIVLFAVLGLGIIAVSVFVGIQIGKNQVPSQQPVVTQRTSSQTQMAANPSALPTTIPTADPTLNWKTYSNSDAKIFFKYPSSLSVTDVTQGTGIIIKITGIGQEISLVVEPTTERDFYTGKKVSETLVFNNISWSYLTGEIQYCDGGECGGISDALRTINQGKRYTIVLGNLKYPEETLNQVLSTFEFTN